MSGQRLVHRRERHRLSVQLFNGGMNVTHSQWAASELENGGDRVKQGSLPPPQRSPNHPCSRCPDEQALMERGQPRQTPLVVKVPKCSS